MILEQLTPPQERLMRFIGSYWQENSVTPSYSEMMKALQYSSPAPLQFLVKALTAKGYLTIDAGRHRNIRIVHTIGNIPVVGVCN